MGVPPFHQVSEVGEVGGCVAAKEEGVTETRGDSPQSFSSGWDGHANVSWDEPPLYSVPTSLNGSGMTPQLSSYVLLLDLTNLTAISKPALPVASPA
jgi:hypothetical protein